MPRYQIPPTLTERQAACFRSYCGDPDERGCVPWTGMMRPDGYGLYRVRIRGRVVACGAHRLAYWLANPHADPSKAVCHSCDNRRCVNVRHMFLGSVAENTRDAMVKGRLAAGERSPHSKLRLAQVRSMRARYADGEGPASLARRFGVTAMQVWRVVTRRSWRWV